MVGLNAGVMRGDVKCSSVAWNSPALTQRKWYRLPFIRGYFGTIDSETVNYNCIVLADFGFVSGSFL